jgi:hypothetical protein
MNRQEVILCEDCTMGMHENCIPLAVILEKLSERPEKK